MARKSVGYTKLEWTCPNCGARNPGPQKTCSGCGAAQPADVKFEQTEGAGLITDEAEIQKAKAGADIHCAYCGARNPAGTEICTNCGGDLKEGKQREAGQVVGAFEGEKKEEKPCPACGALNPVNALNCNQCGSALSKPAAPAPVQPTARKVPLLAWIGLGILALILCICGIIGITRLTRTQEITGTVQDVSWQRVIAVEVLGPVEKEDWKEKVPANAKILDCGYKYAGEADQPAPVATEVCGTPYAVDEGSGYGEVVQDCVYRVYEEACRFTVEEWRASNPIVLEGSDFTPQWPEVQLAQNQRLGERSEEYRIIFKTDNDQFTYITRDFDLFQQCRPGSAWTLKVNAMGGVVSIDPK